MAKELKITVGETTIGPIAKRLIVKTLTKNRLSYGELTIKLEKEFARIHGAKYGIFTVSGTSALQVALHAMKSVHRWKDGDEIIVPAVTFVATSNIVLANNLKPVFVDVDPNSYNMDPGKIEEKITRKTRAIIPVHLFGQPAAMDKISKIAKEYGLKILVDSCETMFVKYRGRPLASWGDIVCFSTYVAHLMATGVGGIMLTQSEEYATKMRSLMNHGRDTIYYNIDDDDKVKGEKAIFKMADRRFSFIDIGYSYRLTEMEAALGIEGLKELPGNVKSRQKNAEYLLRNLSSLGKYFKLPYRRAVTEHAYMMFPIVIEKGSGISRQEIITYLESNGIETRYMMPLLNQPIYRKLFPNLEQKYPVAKWINENGFYIGCHQYLSKKDLDYVIKKFKDFLASR